MQKLLVASTYYRCRMVVETAMVEYTRPWKHTTLLRFSYGHCALKEDLLTTARLRYLPFPLQDGRRCILAAA